jgi:hypothetical protein
LAVYRLGTGEPFAFFQYDALRIRSLLTTVIFLVIILFGFLD